MKLDENFNQQEFNDWVEDFLPDFSRDIRKVDVPNAFTSVKSITTLGESALGVRIYIIETDADPSKRKVGLATDSFNLLRNYGSPNAIIAYYSKDAPLWRISLLTSTPIWSEGKIITKLSNPKRQSYVLGSKAKIKTPYLFLLSKGKVIDFTDLKSRFSLEVVNKEFYKEISQAFTRLVGGSVANGKSKKTFEPLLKLPSLQDRSQTNLEFAVRLIGRIIFCWFLREKRSETGHSLIPKELVSFDAANTTQDYYHKILEPIFFEILNKPIRSRKENFINDLFSAIPYLNGGLFSPHEDDFFNYNEEKQTINHNTVVIPDEWLKSFFEVLETYNFTIDENTSFDEELSIDPEMLGRIFENLLAEINPETGESARKSTGSYYTPRIIVDYMIDESLLLYLKEKTGIEENKLRSLISYDLEDDQSDPLNEDEKDKITQSLGIIKILDPACGSGAFPIGALQKIVFILQQIDQNGQLWFKKQIQNTPVELRKVIEREFHEKNFDYIRKLGIIRENIYGIDIQPIATEISRLRCFLTLVVDERIDNSLDNRGIEPLPNLDFKFVTANSLIGLPNVKLDQQELFDDNSKIEQLKSLRDQYFTARNEERKDIMIAFSELQSEMINELIDRHSFTGVAKAELTRKLTEWKPFKHSSSDWFDPEWMFGIKDGFDIVIGNPPYSRIQGIDKKLVEKYKNTFKTATGRFDLYILFAEKGLELANPEIGQVNYIMPHKWTNASFGKGLREFVSQNRFFSKLISFGAYQVFNASTYTSLVWFSKNTKKYAQFMLLNKDLATNFELEYFLRDLTTDDFTKIDSETLGSKPWVLTKSKSIEVLDKLRQQPKSMKDLFDGVFQGIVTTGDDIFYLKGEIRDKDFYGYSERLQEDVVIEADLVKPVLMGDDIGRYAILQNKLFVLYPHVLDQYGKTRPLEEEELAEKYPRTFKYLSKFKTELEKKKIKYKTNSKYWYALHRSRELSIFEQDKIITPYLSLKGSMTFDDKHFYTNAKCYCLIKKQSIGVSYLYLLAILNSKILWFYLKNTGTMFRGGYYAYTSDYLDSFPIPITNDQNIIKILEEKVKQIYSLNLKINNENNQLSKITELSTDIDEIVYKLYKLSPSEINIVEGDKNVS